MAESITVSLILDDRQYTGKLGTAIDDTKRLGKAAEDAGNVGLGGFNKLSQGADLAITKLKGLVAAYLSIEAVTSALRLGDELSDLSKATDISIQKIIQLQGALQAAGGNGEDAGRMIQQLINTLDGAAQGSADAQYQLMRLGLSFKEMTNLSPEAALNRTIEALAKMTNPIERNALAFQLLGKAARGIDWEEVARRTSESASNYDAAAAAAQKAGEVFDRFAESAKNVKIGLMLALEPLGGLLDYLGKLVGGTGGGLVDGLVIAFKGLAVVVATVATFLKSVVDDIKTLAQAVPLVIKQDWSGVGKLFGENAQNMKQDWKNLADYVSGLDVFNQQGKAGAGRGLINPPTVTPSGGGGGGGGNPAAVNAMQGQINGILGIGDAYAKANERAREKLQTDYLLAGSSEEFKKITEETTRITNEAADKIENLKDKLKNLTPQQRAFGVGTAIEEAIKAIEKDRDTSVRAAQQIITENEARIRSINDIKAAYEASTQAAMAGNEQLFAAQGKIRDAEDARRQNLMGPLAKALDQIRIEEERAADAARKRELATGKYTNAEGDITQADQLAQAYKRIGEQLDANIKRRQEQATTLIQEQQSFSYGWDEAFKKYIESANNAAQQAGSVFTTFAKGFEDAIVKFVQTGKLSFKDLVNTMLAQFVRLETSKFLTMLLGGGNAGSFGSTIFGFFSGLFGKAGGGMVSAGKPYMVGESGRELFVPSSAGSIVPNSGLGSQQVVNNYYSISAVDARSVAQLFAENRMTLLGTVRQAEKELPFRGRG